MSKQILHLDRIEFKTVKIDANRGDFPLDKVFPQLTVADESLKVLTRSSLYYPPEEIRDPRVFVLTYGIKIENDPSAETPVSPYEVEVEASAFFRYVGGDEFANEERFRAVRFSGYQILYGAIREMVSGVTARSRHGLWHLPARTFGAVAAARAKEDQAERASLLAKLEGGSTAAQVSEETTPTDLSSTDAGGASGKPSKARSRRLNIARRS